MLRYALGTGVHQQRPPILMRPQSLKGGLMGDRIILALLGGTLGIAAITGCSTPNGGRNASRIETDRLGAASTTAVAPSGSPPDSAYYSPLNTFLFGGGSDPQTAVEQFIERCMSSRGWRYSVSSANQTPQTIGGMRSFRQTYGYGVLSSPDKGLAAEQDYVDSLTSDQQVRFYQDLGTSALGSVPDPQFASSYTTGSCTSSAIASAESYVPLYNDAARQAVGQAEKSIQSNPQFIDAIRRWSGCMSQYGYTVSVLEQPAQDIRSAEKSGLTTAQMGDLRTTELKEAGVDFQCQEGSIMPVRQSLETAAVEQLRLQFPAYAQVP